MNARPARRFVLAALACVLTACHWLFPHAAGSGAGDSAGPADGATDRAADQRDDLVVGEQLRARELGLDGPPDAARGGVSLDPAFGAAGAITIDGAQQHEDYAAGVAVDAQGRIVVVGMVTVGFTPPSAYNKDLALWRYLPDGKPDPSFDQDGALTYQLGNWDWGRDLALLADGKIVVGGNIDNTFDRPTLWRFLENGALDTTFGTSSGKSLLSVASAEVQGTDLAVDPASGEYLLLGNQQGNWLTVGRFNAQGTLQKSFGTTGYVTFKSLPSATGARLKVDQAGRVVVAGSSRPGGSTTDLMVVRFLPDGSLDSSFAGKGYLSHDGAGGTPGAHETAQDLELDAQGNLWACGSTSGGKGKLVVWKLRADGSLDPAFGAQGVLVDQPGAASEGSACRLDGIGRLVVAGTSSDTTGRSLLTLWRLLPSGAIDPSFGGKAAVVDATPGRDQHVRSLALAANGRAIVCGHVGSEASSDAALWRVVLP